MTLCDSCSCVTYPTKYKFGLSSYNTHLLALDLSALCVCIHTHTYTYTQYIFMAYVAPIIESILFKFFFSFFLLPKGFITHN